MQICMWHSFKFFLLIIFFLPFEKLLAQQDSIITTVFREDDSLYNLREDSYNSNKLLYKIKEFNFNSSNQRWYPTKTTLHTFDADTNITETVFTSKSFFNHFGYITPDSKSKKNFTYFPGHLLASETFSHLENGVWKMSAEIYYTYTLFKLEESIHYINYHQGTIQSDNIDSIFYDTQNRKIAILSYHFNTADSTWNVLNYVKHIYSSTNHNEPDTIYDNGYFNDSLSQWIFTEGKVNFFNALNEKIATHRITNYGNWVTWEKLDFTYTSLGNVATISDSIFDNGHYHIETFTTATYNNFGQNTSWITNIYLPTFHVYEEYKYYDVNGFLTETFDTRENNGGDIYETRTNVYYYKTYGDSSVCNPQNKVLYINGGNSYFWNTGAISDSIFINQSGDYSCTVSLSNGWTFQSVPHKVSAFSTLPTAPHANDSSITVCANSALRLNTNGASGLSYQWLRNDTIIEDAIFPNLFLTTNNWLEGGYRVIFSNACGSDTSSTTNVNKIVSKQVNITSNDPLTFCNGDSVVLIADSGFVSYWWNGSYMLGTPIHIARNGGIKEVKALDSNGCLSIASLLLTKLEGNEYNINITQQGPQLQFSYSGNVPAQWYLNDTLIPGANQYSISPNRDGYYSVRTGGDSACWKVSIPYYFEQNKLVANAGSDYSSCIYGPYNVRLGYNNFTAYGGVPPYTYSWTPSFGLDDTTLANPICSIKKNTLYILTVTDSIGNIAKDSINISFFHIAAPEILKADTTLCYGRSLPINQYSSNNLYYLLKDDSAYYFYYQYFTNKLTESGTYKLFMRNVYNLCYSDTSAAIHVTVLPNISDSSFSVIGNPPSCGGTGIRLVAKEDAHRNYLWKKNSNNSYQVIGGDTSQIEITNTSLYELTVSDTNNCHYTTQKYLDPSQQNLFIEMVGSPMYCREDSVKLSCYYDSSYSYQWYRYPNESLLGETQHEMVVRKYGVYYVEVSSQNGCNGISNSIYYQPTQSIFLTINRNNTMLTVSYQNLTAGPGSHTYLTLSTDYFYVKWYKDGILIPGADSASYDTQGEHGIFMVAVDSKNQEFCESFQYIDLNFKAITSGYGFSCDSTCTGKIYINGTGYSPFTYFINNQQVNWLTENLCSGTYLIKIIDALGDSVVLIKTFTNDLLVTSVVQKSSCITCTDGSIYLQPSGGTPPYSYSWSPNSGILIGDTISNLTAGIYRVCISDTLGCLFCRTDTITGSILGLSSQSSVSAVSIGINAGTQQLNVTLPDNMHGFQYEFILFDILGKIIVSKELKESVNSFEIKAARGLYLYSILNREKNISTGKIIIQ